MRSKMLLWCALCLCLLVGCGQVEKSDYTGAQSTAPSEITSAAPSDGDPTNINIDSSCDLEESVARYIHFLALGQNDLTTVDFDAIEAIEAPDITIDYEYVTKECRDQILHDYYTYKEQDEVQADSFCTVLSKWYSEDGECIEQKELFLLVGSDLYSREIEQALIGKKVDDEITLSMPEMGTIPSVSENVDYVCIEVQSIRTYEPGPNVNELECEGIYSAKEAYSYLFKMRENEQYGVNSLVLEREWIQKMEENAEFVLYEQSVREYAYDLILREIGDLNSIGISSGLDNGIESEEAQKIIAEYVDFSEYKIKEILLIGALAKHYEIHSSIEEVFPNGTENMGLSQKEEYQYIYERIRRKVLQEIREKQSEN